MNAVIRVFVQICLLRMGPQDLPDSPLLLGVALAAHVVTGVALSALMFEPASALLAALTGTVILAALTTALLAVNRLSGRLVRTLTALAGADSVIAFLAIPMITVLHGAPDAAIAGVVRLLVLALIVWSIAVYGHVLRNALGAPMVVGVVVAIVFYWVSIGTLRALFP